MEHDVVGRFRFQAGLLMQARAVSGLKYECYPKDLPTLNLKRPHPDEVGGGLKPETIAS